MPLNTNHQEFGPCGMISLLRGMLLVTSEDLEQCQRVLMVLHWCEDRGETRGSWDSGVVFGVQPGGRLRGVTF
jgi:hypothetical protein